jgi:hypothetical protein
MLIVTLRPPEGIDSARSFYDNSYKDLHHRCGFCRHRAHGLRSNRLGVRSRHRAARAKLSAAAMTGENHKAVMKHAKRVRKNTTLFINNGELYSLCGALDPTGIYRPDPF